MNVETRIVNRGKKAQSLDVVHMQVGEQDIHTPYRRRNRRRQTADSRAHIKHQYRAFAANHAHAGGVAAVARGFRAGRSERATSTP